MRVVAIVGSPRVQGNTNFLVQEALKEIAEAGIETETVVVSRQKIGFCLSHDDCGAVPACYLKDDMRSLMDSFWAADGVVLASPAYFGNVSGHMKVFIDRNRFYYRQQKKLAARSVGVITVAATDGMETTRDALRRFLRSVSGLPQEKVHSVIGYTRPAAARDNPALIEEAREMGRKMARDLT